MCHADTMEVTLGDGSLIYQISVEDEHSRGYMALCVFPMKHSYFVILTLLRAFSCEAVLINLFLKGFS